MTERLDALSVREYEQGGEKKTAFTRIGVAFKTRDNTGWVVKLDAIPAPVDGQFTLLLKPPQQRQVADQNKARASEPPPWDAPPQGY